MARNDFWDWYDNFWGFSDDTPTWFVLACIGAAATGAGIAYVYDALQPTREEQDEAIATISPEEQQKLKMNYDAFLLEKMAEGVGIEKAHEEARKTIPDEDGNKAVYYLLDRHAKIRFRQSADETVSHHTVYAGKAIYTQTETEYTFRSDFAEKLQAEHNALKIKIQNKGLPFKLIGNQGKGGSK